MKQKYWRVPVAVAISGYVDVFATDAGDAMEQAADMALQDVEVETLDIEPEYPSEIPEECDDWEGDAR